MANNNINNSRSDVLNTELLDEEIYNIDNIRGNMGLRIKKPTPKERYESLTDADKAEAIERLKNSPGDYGKLAVNTAVNVANTIPAMAQIPTYGLNALNEMINPEMEGELLKTYIIPDIFDNEDYSNPSMKNLETITTLGVDMYAFPKALGTLAIKSPKIYQKLKEAFPYSVGQFMDTINIKGLKGIKEGMIPNIDTLKKVQSNLLKIIPGAFTLGAVDKIVGEPKEMSRGGDPDQDNSEYGGAFSNPITQEDPYMDIQKFINQPGYESYEDLEIFDVDMPLAEKKSNNFLDDIEGVKVANIFGKVPAWAVAGIDKAKILKESYSKGEANILNSIKNKIVKEDSYEAQDTDTSQFLDDLIPDGTEVTNPKSKKIIDSPEEDENIFYSGLEARLMDPNTPDEFTDAESLYKFLNSKGIPKVEVDDNALTEYLKSSKNSGVPLDKNDLLKIIRKAPIRGIDRITYGSNQYGGVKNPQYANSYMEPGYVPGSYRENVVFLKPENIPMDPGVTKSGDQAHSFDEKYVLGWTRSSDRLAINPYPPKNDGIASLAAKEVETLTKNIDTVGNQARELKLSALKKLSEENVYVREYFDDGLVDSDVTINRLYTNYADELKAQDRPLYNQIEAFDEKLYKDAEKLKIHNNSSQEGYINVTFADEIQSDILQQAKKFEEKMTRALGDLIDTNATTRANAIAGDYRLSQDLNPEVVEFFLKNKTVFRPMFKDPLEMQQFLDKFVENKMVFNELAAAGVRPSKELQKKAFEAAEKEKVMLSELKTSLSENAMKYLYPNVPFKNRTEWGSALIKNDLSIAANRLYGEDAVEGAGEWYAVSPSKYITKRYSQSGGTATPLDQRTKEMKGIGMEEFYGGPDSVDPKGKHYTSAIEKILKKAAKDNNSEFKIIKVKLDDAEYANTPSAINEQVKNPENFKEVFAIKITPEMLLPSKTHRKSGGFMYTPEDMDIFEVA